MEKIIIVHYVGVGNASAEQVYKIMQEYKRYICKEEGITHYLLACKNHESRIECINPKLVSEEDYTSAKAALDKATAAAEEFADKCAIYKNKRHGNGRKCI